MAYNNIHRIEHIRFVRNLPVKANEVLKKGELILSQDADGYCAKGAGQANCKAVGVAIEDVDATGLASGAATIDVEQGIFLFDNSGTDAIAIADVAKKGTAYCEDYKTVAKTAGALSPVGPIVGLGWETLGGVAVRIES